MTRSAAELDRLYGSADVKSPQAVVDDQGDFVDPADLAAFDLAEQIQGSAVVLWSRGKPYKAVPLAEYIAATGG